MFPTHPDRTDCFCGSRSRIGIHITLYKLPSPVICHSFHTSKMTETHQEQLIDHLRVFLVFIEFNFLLYLIFSRHRRQQNLAPAQPASPSPPPSPPRRRRKPQNPWVLIHRGKLHLTAIPMEGWKNDHLQVYPPGLQSHFEGISTRVSGVPHWF